MNSNYQIEEKEGGIAEIFIYGLIGGWDIEDVNASSFVKEFKALEQSHDRINVRINSPGGSLWEGLAIASTISQSQKDVHTYVDGIAYSMAGIIALSGKTVHAAKSSLLMIHNCSGLVVGNAQSMRTGADELDKYDQTIAQAIATKTGKELQEVLSLYFDYKDHYFTAAEALELGLVNVIEEQGSTPIPVTEPPAPSPAPDPAAPEPDPKALARMTYNQVLNRYSQRASQPEQVGIIASLRSKLFGSKPKEAPSATTAPIAKVYSQADFDQRVSAIESKFEAKLFVAENQAEALMQEAANWKAKAEEYGAQPGTMPSTPVSAGNEFSDEESGKVMLTQHLYQEAQAVKSFLPRT